ncbi:hypothetical protein RI129_006410 [Pyrocoelia pectoralis]|uniref:Elongation of very long chain fatty acids protein n=1 Tax=Pyrocoelia pectoralis TaxID=417401 RepID=A0AAN7ZG64_9COLE
MQTLIRIKPFKSLGLAYHSIQISIVHYTYEAKKYPRVKDLFLMSSPFPTIAIMLIYLYFIFILGPKLMEKRSPFKINKILVIYNMIQIILCSSFIYQYVTNFLFHYNILCEPIDYSNSELGLRAVNLVWSYFMLKLIDLIDTVFFVLRKKYSQISFLHVYHHTGMCVFGWVGTKYVAGGHGCFIGIFNCLVHVIMYFYYLLTAWDKKYKNNVWWKKHLTQLQIAQFVAVTIHLLLIFFQPNCDYPRWIVCALLPQNFLMIVLFSNFYIKAYLTEKKPETRNVVDKKTN